jgi:hypothetical protein
MVAQPRFQLVYVVSSQSCQYPLGPSLYELVQHKTDIRKDESANEEAEELRCVPGAQLKANVCLRGMLETWIFHLTGNLIYTSCQ